MHACESGIWEQEAVLPRCRIQSYAIHESEYVGKSYIYCMRDSMLYASDVTTLSLRSYNTEPFDSLPKLRTIMIILIKLYMLINYSQTLPDNNCVT